MLDRSFARGVVARRRAVCALLIATVACHAGARPNEPASTGGDGGGGASTGGAGGSGGRGGAGGSRGVGGATTGGSGGDAGGGPAAPDAGAPLPATNIPPPPSHRQVFNF